MSAVFAAVFHPKWSEYEHLDHARRMLRMRSAISEAYTAMSGAAARMGVSKPSYEGPEVKRQVSVSVNSGYQAGRTPCQPRIRRDHAIPDHDPSIRERSSLRRVQSSHRRPDGPSGFCGDRQPSTSLGEREMRGLRRFDFKNRSLWNDAVHHVTPQGD